MSTPLGGRLLPPNYKHCLEATFTRKFTWRERFLILIGQAATIQVFVATEHKPGKFRPEMKMLLDPTPEATADNPTIP